MLTIISFLAVFAILVLAHEVGHFITAKLSGVTIQEFGFGYPPRLFAVKVGGTEYSVNLLPLGGFVKMLGEEDPSDPGSLAGKPVPTRLLVLSAGSIMNILLPLILFSASFMIPSQNYIGQVQVAEIAPNSPAEGAGIKPGDIILKVNGRRIENTRDLSYNIHLNLGSEISVLLQKGRYSQEEVRVIPRWNPPPGQGAIGVAVNMVNAYPTTVAYPVWEAVPMGVRSGIDTLTLAKNEIISLFVRGVFPQVAGPIGIAQITGEVARMGLGPLLELAALLSMNLGVINIMPIPMLDGGRIFFVLIEVARRGKRIPPEKEGLVHLIGFAVLIAIMVLVSYYDILRIIRGESLIR